MWVRGDGAKSVNLQIFWLVEKLMMRTKYDNDENVNDDSFDYSDDSFLEESMYSSSDSSEDDTDED